jgi:hypothetical protein
MSDVNECDTLNVRKDFGYLGHLIPVCVTVRNNDAQDSNFYDTPFFIADRHYEVVSAQARFSNASFVGGTVYLYKVPSGTAPGSGSDVLLGGVDVNFAVDYNFKIYGNEGRHLNPGDSLCLHGVGIGGLFLRGFCLCANLRAL